ncbi:MAG: FkbM family methyltransferase [Gemmatimonadales bacterium]
MNRDTVHKCIRTLTKHYPSRKIAQEFNSLLGWLCFDCEDPHWMVADAFDVAPTIVLDMSNRLLRKMYYFPKAWCRWWMEQDLSRFMRLQIGPGSTFVDVGSNVGFYSLFASGLVGEQGRVFAFEPEPVFCESLRRSAQENGFSQLHCSNAALSDRTTTASFYRAWDSPASSLVPEVPGREKRYRERIQVPVTTLDDYLTEHPAAPPEIGLIKVDVEGEEVRAVSGMVETLASRGFPPMWVEVRGPEGSTRAPDTFPAVHALLQPLGYRPYRWSRGKSSPVSVGDVRDREDILFRSEASGTRTGTPGR